MIKLDNVKQIDVSEPFINEVSVILDKRLGMTGRMGIAQERALEAMLSPRGKDRLITRMKRLNFQSFTAQKTKTGIYLVGKTDDIEMEIRGDRYNLGPYYVATSENSIVKAQLSDVHVFPGYDPCTRYRHLHHSASPRDYNENEITNPLDAASNTCWASVGPSYRSAIEDCDIADIFRILYIFIIRLNWHSPLCSRWTPEAIKHGVRL